MGSSLSWSLLMLLLVGAMVPATMWLLRRVQQLRPGAGAERRMAVVDQLSLGPRERLVTVRVGARLLVLGVTSQNVALVTELHEAQLVETTPLRESA
ncbi:flagellar biosynthetic protein FliO [Ramlibacter sp. MAHUQ-53]|uniref:flagellar biosynthetic protein FliO n=1 Tax=unclassified Ramlibacter TaxID=2617605 RepID=UPI00363D292C